MDKIKIELSPLTAMTILSFLQEFEYCYTKDSEMAEFRRSVEEFGQQVYANTTKDHIDETTLMVEANQAIGTMPQKCKCGKTIFKDLPTNCFNENCKFKAKN